MSVGIYGAMVGLGQAAPTIGQGVRQTIGAVQFGPVRKRVAEAFALLTAGNTDSAFSSEARGGGAKAAMPATTPAATTLAATAPATGIASTQPQAIERSSQEPPMVGAKPPLESGAARPLVGQNQSAASGANRQRVMEQLKQDLGILSQSDDPRDIQTVERIQSSLASLEQRRSEIEIQQQESIARRALEERELRIRELAEQRQVEGAKTASARVYRFDPNTGITRVDVGKGGDRSGLMTFEEAQVAENSWKTRMGVETDKARTRIAARQGGPSTYEDRLSEIRQHFTQQRSNNAAFPDVIRALDEQENRAVRQLRIDLGMEEESIGTGQANEKVKKEYNRIATAIAGMSPQEALDALGGVETETPEQLTAYRTILAELQDAAKAGKDVGIEVSLDTMSNPERVEALLERFGGFNPSRSATTPYGYLEEPRQKAMAARRVLQSIESGELQDVWGSIPEGAQTWIQLKLKQLESSLPPTERVSPQDSKLIRATNAIGNVADRVLGPPTPRRLNQTQR